MSLTADQITAQNFKDFYGQIRPYLNGQVPTFANQFSRSDLYSTDEKIIGSWTDGKPLYQRTYHLTNITVPSTHASTEIVIANNTSYDINVVNSYGFVSSSWEYDGTRYLPVVSTALNGDIYWAAFVFQSSLAGNAKRPVTFFLQNITGAPTSIDSVDITLQYTKPSDSAIKVGTGTDYSTDEQIIGSWIDGKPLYQKTFSGTVSSANNITYVSIGASVDTFVDGRGVLNNSVPLIGVTNESVSAGVSTFVNTNSAASNKNTFGVYSKPESQSAWVGLSYYFTLCYTKTTD